HAVPLVCHRHLSGTQTPHESYELFRPVYTRAPRALGSGLSQCHASVAYPAGPGLSGFLPGGVPIHDDLTPRAADTAIGCGARASGAGADPSAKSDGPAALVSLDTSP